jgi:hypothetical protein
MSSDAGDTPSGVDRQTLAGNGTGLFAEQEERGAGNVFGVDDETRATTVAKVAPNAAELKN